MSQQGYLAWYTNSAEVDLFELLEKLPPVIGFDRADFVSRHSIVNSLDDPVWHFDDVEEKPMASELRRLYRPDKVLHIKADFAQLGKKIERGVIDRIPQEIRGDFMPNRPYLTIGQHFWSDTENEEVQTPFRAMVGCWGYSTPNDGEGFKRLILTIPEVLEVKNTLESIMGPVQVACYFTF